MCVIECCVGVGVGEGLVEIIEIGLECGGIGCSVVGDGCLLSCDVVCVVGF